MHQELPTSLQFPLNSIHLYVLAMNVHPETDGVNRSLQTNGREDSYRYLNLLVDTPALFSKGFGFSWASCEYLYNLQVASKVMTLSRLTLAAPVIVYRVLNDKFLSDDGFPDSNTVQKLSQLRLIAFGVFVAALVVFWMPLIVWKSVVSPNPR